VHREGLPTHVWSKSKVQLSHRHDYVDRDLSKLPILCSHVRWDDPIRSLEKLRRRRELADRGSRTDSHFPLKKLN